MVVRTVEAPFFRRAKLEYSGPNLNNKLIRELRSLLGEPIKEVDKSFVPTMDGSGILFVSYDGQVYPSGFLPLPLGNVRERSIVDIYRNNDVLVKIRGEEHSRHLPQQRCVGQNKGREAGREVRDLPVRERLRGKQGQGLRRLR